MGNGNPSLPAKQTHHAPQAGPLPTAEPRGEMRSSSNNNSSSSASSLLSMPNLYHSVGLPSETKQLSASQRLDIILSDLKKQKVSLV